MKDYTTYLKEKFEKMTEDQVARVLHSNMEEGFMRYGVEITKHIDTTLEMVDLYTIEGIEGFFLSEKEAAEKAKEIFVEKAKDLLRNGAYVVFELDRDGNKVYTEGLRGLGDTFGWYNAYEVENAKWFYNLADVMEHIKRHGLECGALSVELVPLHKLYLDLTGKYLCL